MTFGYIYKVTNLLNNMIYIGLKIGIPDKSKGYFGSGLWIKRSIKKHGKENFYKEIICICENKKELNEKEIFYIDYYRKNNYLMYNISDGGIGNILSGNLNPFYGKKHSEKTKKHWSEIRRGVKNKNLGRNRIGKCNNFYGKKHSKETIELLKLRFRKENHPLWGKRGGKECKWAKPVLQIDKKEMTIIKRWDAVVDDARFLKKHPATISRCCTGKRKSAYGYIWKHLE
jgi:group I intron endonuclease